VFKTTPSLKNPYALLPAEPGKWKRENGTGGVIPENKARKSLKAVLPFFRSVLSWFN
jgi:hypothetical protein